MANGRGSQAVELMMATRCIVVQCIPRARWHHDGIGHAVEGAGLSDAWLDASVDQPWAAPMQTSGIARRHRQLDNELGTRFSTCNEFPIGSPCASDGGCASLDGA
jgi:hypothetical protein